jgi:3-hydroxyacyl-[acyl-carrier-protein] dehydratase
MRWQLIDEFLILQKGSHSKARKSFFGSEDFFRDHFPGKPVVPQTLLTEMIAQTAGVLYGLDIDFKKEVILVKIVEAHFPKEAIPPCELLIDGKIEEESENGAWISGIVHSGPDTVAEARMLLATMDTLEEKQDRKIVFNDRFLSYFRIREVAERSGVPS